MLDGLATSGSSGPIATTTASCVAHRYHDPRPTYCELHHIVPRAWQEFWAPEIPPAAVVVDGESLWDGRTVALCRSGHGNVHYWIMTLTHAWEAGDSIDDVAHRVRSRRQGHVGRADFALALEGLTRYLHVGGSIDDLVAAGHWGQI